MLTPSIDTLLAAVRAKGFVTFAKPYDLNLIGLRAMPGKPDAFDDLFCIVYTDDAAKLQIEAFPCTTDPGLYHLQNPKYPSGTGIVVPGQYRRCWTLGLHQQKYPALVQRGNITIALDANRDGVLDYGSRRVTGDSYGINCHHAGRRSTVVGKWSAGCQVLANLADDDRKMELCRLQVAHGHGEWFSYALLEWPSA